MINLCTSLSLAQFVTGSSTSKANLSEKYEILKTFIVTRHGSRIPSENTHVKKWPFVESLKDADLTYQGELQMRLMGKFIKDNTGCQNVSTEVLSSPATRSVSSAQFFLAGMGIKINSSDIPKNEKISRGYKEGDNKALMKSIENSKERNDTVEAFRSSINLNGDVESVKEKTKIASSFVSLISHQIKFQGKDVLTELDLEKYAMARKFVKIYQYTHPTILKEGGREIMEHITQDSKHLIGKSESASSKCDPSVTKRVSSNISLVSGHDGTIVFLQGLLSGQPQEVIFPRYATMMLVHHVYFAGKIWVCVDMAGLGLKNEIEQVTRYIGSYTSGWSDPIFYSGHKNSVDKEIGFLRNIPKGDSLPVELCDVYGYGNVISYDDLIKHRGSLFPGLKKQEEK